MALPAAVTRASTLLEHELEHQKVTNGARTFFTGIKAIDQGLSPGLWSGGRSTGVISGRGPSLIEEIVSEHLLSFHDNIVRNREPGTGFIIAPHSSRFISSIHSRIADRLRHASETQPTLDAIQYLEKVQLLQYFDFAGLTETVAEVSALLFEMNNSSAVRKIILYLEGIAVAIENCQRRSGIIQANALLSSLLRTLVHLSRMYPSLLILLDLGMRKDSKGDDAIQSAFASATASDIQHQPGGALSRTLAGALDVVVIEHDAHGTATAGSMIVEVVQDRTGGAQGQWAVWDSKE